MGSTPQVVAPCIVLTAKMNLPQSPRVVYGKKTLERVVCQLRFPPILRIEAKPPDEFQDQIRAVFPLIPEPDVPAVAGAGMPREVQQLLKAVVPGRPTQWRFCTEAKDWEVTLAKEFLAVSTSDYTRWEGFRDKLEGPLSALVSQYQPAFFSRIGLRYQNYILRSALEIRDKPWTDLLRPEVTGLLGATAPDIEEFRSVAVFALPDAGKVRLAAGIAFHASTGEPAFSIDADLFLDKRTEVTDARDRLNALNVKARRLFRWCISDELHGRLEPNEIRESAAS